MDQWDDDPEPDHESDQPVRRTRGSPRKKEKPPWPYLTITSHALIRYAERVAGIDVETLRTLENEARAERGLEDICDFDLVGVLRERCGFNIDEVRTRILRDIKPKHGGSEMRGDTAVQGRIATYLLQDGHVVSVLSRSMFVKPDFDPKRGFSKHKQRLARTRKTNGFDRANRNARFRRRARKRD